MIMSTVHLYEHCNTFFFVFLEKKTRSVQVIEMRLFKAPI